MEIRRTKKTKIYGTVIMSLFVFNIILTVYKLYQSGVSFMDFHARWQECAYFCRGINPFMVSSSNVIHEIGYIDSAMVTVPWAWLLGMVINPGFLSYNAAKYVGVFMYLGVYIITSAVLYRYWINILGKGYEEDDKWAMMSSLLLGCQIYWWWAFACGNQGAISACLIIISVCIYKKHPIGCGVLMLFAMIKPQLAAIFFVVFLLEKEVKVILTTLIGGILTCISIVIVTKTHIYTLVEQAYSGGSSLKMWFFGLFDSLKFFGISTSAILALDIVCGLAYVIIYWYLAKKRHINNTFVLFSGVAVASTFWFYKQPHDIIILTVPCLAFLHLGYLCVHNSKKYIFLILVLVGSFYLQGATQFALKMINPNVLPELATSIGLTANRICLMICGFCCIDSIYEQGVVGLEKKYI